MAKETSLNLCRVFFHPWTATISFHMNEVRKECQESLHSNNISFVLSTDKYPWFCALGWKWPLSPWENSVYLDISLYATDKASEVPVWDTSQMCDNMGTAQPITAALQLSSHLWEAEVPHWDPLLIVSTSTDPATPFMATIIIFPLQDFLLLFDLDSIFRK